jgi:hypothetical protein
MIGSSTARAPGRALSRAALVGAAVLTLAPAPACADDPAVALAPHKAIYPLELKKVNTESKIVAASGAIYYEMADGCRDWRTKYILILRLTRADKVEVVSRTEFDSVESKPGRRYSFKSRTLINDSLSETREGRATLGGPRKSGTAAYSLPNQFRVPLPAGTLFPNQHTIELVRKARAGETTFWAPLFDGADEGKVSGVNALILSKAEPTRGRSPLLTAPGWRFRLSYFDLKKGEQKPNYQMLAVIRDNGVTETVELDYDDFVLEGRASRIERLPKARC